MFKTACYAAIISGLGAGSVLAQDVTPFESNAIYLGSLTLKSGNSDDISVTEEDLNRDNPADLQDLFKSEPTIAVGSSLPISQKVYVNGVEETNLVITIDGARQNNKIFHHMGTNYIDPALLKSVRVDPGVAPADAGAAALGGALSYETVDAGDLLRAGANMGGRVKLEYDSNGDIFSKSGMAYGRHGNFEYLGFLKMADGGLRQDGGGDDIVGSSTNFTSGLLKLAYETEGGYRVELSHERVKDDEARPYRGNIGQITVGRPVPLTRTYDLVRQNTVLSLTHDNPTGLWDPEVRLAFSQSELNIPEATSHSQGLSKSFNGVVQNTFALAQGEITAGVDFFNDTSSLDYRDTATPANNSSGREKLRNVGLFAQARLIPNDATRLSFGLRFDSQSFTGRDGSGHKDSGVSFNVSGEYDINEFATLSAGYSNVWGGTILAENFIMSPAWTYDANGITPVKAENMFVAIDGAVGAWDFNAKLFKTNLRDARVPSWGGGPNLTADLEASGYEIGAAYNWDAGFARIGFADIDTKINGNTADSYTGNYLTMPLGKNITLQASHEFDDLNLRIGGDIQHYLEKKDTYNPDSGSAGPAIPSYTVANAHAEYRFKGMEDLTIRGEVNNIFDADYVSRATYGQEFVNAGVIPLSEPGRSFKISLNFEF